MNILDRARRLESRLAQTMDRAAGALAHTGPREPLEILHAILERVEQRIEPAGRGRHVFPFNRIKVFLVADSREARARFTAVLDDRPSLSDRILERLRSRGCAPADLSVKTVFVGRPDASWAQGDVRLEFDRVAASEPVTAEEPSAPRHIRLTVVHGVAEKSAYAFALTRINLGRCAEVRDGRSRLLRTNHVVFTDGAAAPNESVSRRHAHIEFSPTGHYRVFDNRSAQGTHLVRNGRTILVPPGSRGIRLESGDELVLGEARLSVRV